LLPVASSPISKTNMSATKVISVDSLIATFPNQPIKIRSLPTFETLRVLKQDLQDNAKSITSILGGGGHGYLGLIMSPAEYAIEVGNDANGNPQPFIAPIYPGSRAVVDGATARERKEQVRTYNQDMVEWREYEVVQQALQKLVLKAIDDVYLMPLKSTSTAHNNVHVVTMLTHPFTEYGVIGQKELQRNDQCFCEEWDGAEPFETIIGRIHECVAYAKEAKKPYMEDQILSKVELLVLETGLYNEDMKKWSRKAAVNKTYDLFKAYILKA
jgi:hypothetical protein